MTEDPIPTGKTYVGSDELYADVQRTMRLCAEMNSGHTLLYLWTDSSCSWQYYPRHGYEQVGFGRVPEYSTADEEYTYRLFRKNITQ